MRSPKPFKAYRRPDSGHFQVTISPTSGLPRDVCAAWNRKSFEQFPQALARYRYPTSQAAADQGAFALIQYLKEEGAHAGAQSGGPTVGAWVALFTDAATSPRAARLIAARRAYSPDTLELYEAYWRCHIADDPLTKLPMNDVSQGDILAYMRRLAAHPVKECRHLRNGKEVGHQSHRTVEGTRTFEAVFSFLRMTFREYQKTHPRWVDPFLSIDRPKPHEPATRDALTDQEVARIFAPGVLETAMDRAVAAAMFWAGLRRGEIFALKPEHLDWERSIIRVVSAWKRFDKTEERVLQDPKHHKTRTVPFPDVLKEAIKQLWKETGKQAFVFARKDGSIPTAGYFTHRVRGWFRKAAIELEGRKITPHSARHSLASILEEDGISLRYIQELLGHSDLKTTKGYLHTTEAAVNRIAGAINAEAGKNGDNDPKGLPR